MGGLQLYAGPEGAFVGSDGPTLPSQTPSWPAADLRQQGREEVSFCFSLHQESKGEHQDPKVLQPRAPVNTGGRER